MSDSDASSPLIPIGPGPEEESFVQRKTQLEKEAEERTRLENAWARVRDWPTPDSKPSDHFAFALAINALVDFLGTQGFADHLDNLGPGPKAKSDAQKIYQSLRDRNNVGSVAAQLDEIQRQAERRDRQEREKWRAYGTALWYWLRRGLMKEIVGEPLPPFEAYLSELRSLNTPAALLEKCQDLRVRLAPSNPHRDITSYEAPAILREVWAAMRRMGDEVPPAPDLLKLDKDPTALFSAFAKGQVSERIHPEDVLRAIDEVVSWCVQRGAAESQDGNDQAGRGPGEGASTTPVGQQAAVEEAEARQHAEETNEGGGPALSERQYGVLQALYLLKAFSPEARQTTEEIAKKAEGTYANPEAFKEPIADLKRRKLVGTKEGRGGGCWLSADGSALAKRISPNGS